MAEGVGFEPTVGYQPTTVFKTAALSRSAIPPNLCNQPPSVRAGRGVWAPLLRRVLCGGSRWLLREAGPL